MMLLSSSRASPSPAEELDPYSACQALMRRISLRDDSWIQIMPEKAKDAVLECTSIGDGPQPTTFRGSIEVRGISKQDALAIAKLLLGEDGFIRSSSGHNCFMMTYELSPQDQKTKLSNTSGNTSRASTPPQSRRSLRDTAELTKKLSSSSRNSAAAKSPFLTQSDDDDNTSDGEYDKDTNTEVETVATGTEKVSFRRRLSRLAAAKLRRSIVRATRLTESEMTPKNRRLRFARYAIENCVFAMDDDATYDPFEEDMDNVKRVKVNMMGVQVSELNNSDQKHKISFLIDIDLVMEKWEAGVVPAETLSEICGKARVEDFLMRFKEACGLLQDPQTQYWFGLRKQWTGEYYESNSPWSNAGGRESLVIGCLIRHNQHGVGAVESFDMRGTMKVKYDSSNDAVTHTPEDRDKIKLLLSVGNRVRHRTKGLGTVQCTYFDDVVVRFDDGRLRRYGRDIWHRRLRRIVDEDDPLLKFAWAVHPTIREGIVRVQFVIPDCTPEMVLRNITGKSEFISMEASVEIQERRVIRIVDASTRVLWEQRLMPKPLTPRSFLSKERYGRALDSIVVLTESTDEDVVPEQKGVVRGYKNCDGWVIEPIPMLNSCFVTHVLCIDLAGFVPPDASRSVRDGILTAEALNLIHDFRPRSVGDA